MSAAKTKNFIKFLGTAGARFVTISQMRASGGIWVSYEWTSILIGPGPGSLVKCLKAKLDPAGLDAIIVTHAHIDHCNDLNIMIEAMTHGGSQKRGSVFLPADMLSTQSILLDYFRELPLAVTSFKEKGLYKIEAVDFETPVKHIHLVETYGLKFIFGKKSVSLIVDTKYFDGLIECYKADILIINTVFIEPVPTANHLSLREAAQMISRINPQEAYLTHFGRDIIKNNPDTLAADISRQSGIKIIAAKDGMEISL